MTLTLGLNHRVHVCQWFEGAVDRIYSLIRKGNRDHDASKVQEVNGRSVAVVLELVMTDSSSRGDGGNNGIELFAVLLLECPDGLKILHLVVPLLEMHIPDLVYIKPRERWVDQVGEVGEGRLSRFLENTKYVLAAMCRQRYNNTVHLLFQKKKRKRRRKQEPGFTYRPAVSGVDAVNQVNSVRMLVWCPGKHSMASLLQALHDCLHTSEYGRMRQNLEVTISC